MNGFDFSYSAAQLDRIAASVAEMRGVDEVRLDLIPKGGGPSLRDRIAVEAGMFCVQGLLKRRAADHQARIDNLFALRDDLRDRLVPTLCVCVVTSVFVLVIVTSHCFGVFLPCFLEVPVGWVQPCRETHLACPQKRRAYPACSPSVLFPRFGAAASTHERHTRAAHPLRMVGSRRCADVRDDTVRRETIRRRIAGGGRAC